MMRAPRRLVAVACCVATLLAPSWAHAGVDQDLAEVDARIGELLRYMGEIQRRMGSSGHGRLDRVDSTDRFADSVYADMVGDHERAAEGFFALVTSGSLAGTGLERDAEWSFAESLFALGDLETAEVRYLTIAEVPNHPFRVDAVRRLLDVYVTTGRSDRFYALFEREILSGRVLATPQVTYAVGRSFFRQGDDLRAKSYLSDVPPGTTWYLKARYVLGAVAVRERDLPTALGYFREVVALPALTTEDREVIDQARLAEARVLYETGDYLAAAESYSLVTGETPLLADQLYESIWTWIRMEDWESALRGVEVFTLGFPQHAYTARLKLLIGQLHMNQRDNEGSLAAFDRVLTAYGPVRQRFLDLASSSTGPGDFFRQAVTFGPASAHIDGVPAYATAMLLEDDALARVVDVAAELQDQADDLARSEGLVSEIQRLLGRQAGLTSFEDATFEIAESRAALFVAWADVLSIHARALDGAGTPIGADLTARLEAVSARLGAARAAVAATRAALDAHEMEVATLQIEAADMARVVRDREDDLAVVSAAESLGVGPQDVAALLAELERARTRLSEAERVLSERRLPDVVRAVLESREDAAVVAELSDLQAALTALPGTARTDDGKILDGLYNAVSVTRARMSDVDAQVGQLADSEMALVRAQFERLSLDVASERSQHTRLAASSATLGVELSRDGFLAMSDFFGDALLRADTGVIDVHWSELLVTVDDIERNQKERNAFVAALEERYEHVRTRVGQ
jgi:tetratricopeptide (TPR) repeat protein